MQKASSSAPPKAASVEGGKAGYWRTLYVSHEYSRNLMFFEEINTAKRPIISNLLVNSGIM
jgi:hypothetical protein